MNDTDLGECMSMYLCVYKYVCAYMHVCVSCGDPHVQRASCGIQEPRVIFVTTENREKDSTHEYTPLRKYHDDI